MAEGPNNGRQTFAFNPGEAVQRGYEQGGGYRPSQVVGGQLRGGDQSPAGLNPTNFGAPLGAFFEGLMKPYAERAAKQKFVKGMTDQMYAEAGEEIRAGGSFLTQIFGPSSYEEGAIFYEAKTRVAKAQTDWQAQEQELRTLPQEEVAKRWADQLETVLTGDPLLDDAIQTSMMEASAPMLQSVAKASYKWKQERVVVAQRDSRRAQAEAQAAQVSSLAETSSPTDEQVRSKQVADDNLAAAFIMPYGQDEASFLDGITNDYRWMIQNGYGHAAEVLRERGILNVLPAEDQRKLQDDYARYGNKAVAEAAQDPTIAKMIFDLQAHVINGTASGGEVNKRMEAINAAVTAKTGFKDLDYYDAKDASGFYGQVLGRVRAMADRDEARGYQEEQDVLRENRAAERLQLEAQVKAANAISAANSPNPGLVVAQGGADRADVQDVAYRAFTDGDYALAAKLARDGFVHTTATQAISGSIASAANAGYSRAFDSVYQKFDGLLQADPAAAKAYYGDAYPAMLNYRKHLKGSGSPEAAFAMAFADNVVYGADSGAITRASATVTEFVNSKLPGFWGNLFSGQSELGASGKLALANAVGRGVAIDQKAGGADLSDEALMLTNIRAAYNSNQFEVAGRLGWSNRPGTTPLATLMGLPKDQGGLVVDAVVNKLLKDKGFNGGTSGEFLIERGKDRQGVEQLFVIPSGEDGLDYTKQTVVSVPSLQEAAARYRARLLGKPMPSSPAEKQALLEGALFQTSEQKIKAISAQRAKESAARSRQEQQRIDTFEAQARSLSGF